MRGFFAWQLISSRLFLSLFRERIIQKKEMLLFFSRQGDYYSDEEGGGGGGDVRWLQQDEESDLEAALDWSPQFETESQEVKVELGHTIRLPCRVDRLGESIEEANESLGAKIK